MLLPRWKRDGRLFLYRVVEGDAHLFVPFKELPYDTGEYRAYSPVRVVKVGEIDMDDYLTALCFTPPCANCLQPRGLCDDGNYCSDEPLPSLKLKNIGGTVG